MKRLTDQGPTVNRRNWLVTSMAALAGCGGGSGTVATLPGTGGTGIGMQGQITGFGSVIVNNTKFDDSAATILLDGKTMGRADLRIGMVASIQGTRDPGGTTGTAYSIEAWSIASGVVRPSDIAGTRFQLLGMTITTDATTAFEGIANLAAIRVDAYLAVWGFQLGAEASTWKATRVALVQPAPATVACTGLLDAMALTLNGVQLSGLALNGLVNHQLVRAEGTLNSANGTLMVGSVVVMDASRLASQSEAIELEGIVTALQDASQLSMGSLLVDTTRAVVTPSGQTIAVDSLIEVNGLMRNGVLMAVVIEVKTPSELSQVDITGNIESFEGATNFVVRGQRCDASQANVVTGSLAELRNGLKVRVVGSSNGQELLAITTLYASLP